MRMELVLIFLLLIMPITDSWWAEGSNILLDTDEVCRKARRGKRGKLYEICKDEQHLVHEIKRGIELGFNECESQFRNHKWNCTRLRKSMKKILMIDTRETGFVNAIASAGVTYAVARACTMGNLVDCSCDKRSESRRSYIIQQLRNKNKNKTNSIIKNGDKRIANSVQEATEDAIKQWGWSGCDDNVNFGYRKSKDFFDARYRKRKDIKTLIRLHNNEAGRLTVKQSMRRECKCHGVSASCMVQTCWMKMATFSETGAKLLDRYQSAPKVIARNDGEGFIPDNQLHKVPTKVDLVFSEESPNFCQPNQRQGIFGTRGRECNETTGNCEALCCGRGYNHNMIEVKTKCRCKFKWCCGTQVESALVTCEWCTEQKQIFTCK